ncbi:GAF and ANTAR domain-containing protein [Nocardia blacklockiae]|uniref:GAF and ANTAR domain-containing protein n=1 Tax=Nocardia blacklockiae TaxID=480036 RepID=UPI0018960CB2|nr:GAF and ANTAR domain-containing protein [Nocardia blacklockiae]MBF6170762.1 GAF and ANTAR domain-containing protein [Nocardia blacklockiae]
MSDGDALVPALGRLVSRLPEAPNRSDALSELMGTATDVLALSGAAVTLVEDGRCEVAGALPGELMEVAAAQQDCARGPGLDALRQGTPVAVPDVHRHRERWPEYTGAAVRHGVSAVVELPLQLGAVRLGVLGLYAPAPREWTAADLSLGALLAGLAANHLLTTDRLRRQQQLTDQLQHALDSRIVVEQAKGVIAGARRIGPDAAYDLIRTHARRHRIGVHEVARGIVELGLRL